MSKPASGVRLLQIWWQAYVTGSWPLENGDHVSRPRWDWYLQKLGECNEIPNTIPSGAVLYRPPRIAPD